MEFVLRANPKYSPPDLTICMLYSETPEQHNYIVRVKRIESAERLMAEGYQLLEDPQGLIDPSKKPLSLDEAAELLAVARSTIYKYINNGRLRSQQDTETQKFMVPQSAIEEFLAALREEDVA